MARQATEVSRRMGDGASHVCLGVCSRFDRCSELRGRYMARDRLDSCSLLRWPHTRTLYRVQVQQVPNGMGAGQWAQTLNKGRGRQLKSDQGNPTKPKSN